MALSLCAGPAFRRVVTARNLTPKALAFAPSHAGFPRWASTGRWDPDWTASSSKNDAKLSHATAVIDLSRERAPKDTVIGHDGREYDFYDYHVHQAHHTRILPFVPSAWTQDLGDRPHQIPLRLQEEPIRVFESQDADFDLVFSCLETFVGQAQKLPRDEQRQRYSEQMPGGRALQWLIESGEIERRNLSLEHRFLRALSHCMVAEGLEEQLLLWARVDHRPSYAKSWREDESSMWKGTLLRYLTQAVTSWTDANKVPLQQGLLYFERAIHHGKRLYIPLTQTGSWLKRELLTTDTKPINDGSFDDFLHSVNIWENRLNERPWLRAKLLLHYPSGAKPDPALQFLKSYNTDQASMEVIDDCLSSHSGPAKYGLFYTVLRTARALDKEGRVAEAREALEIGRELLPSFFSGRVPSKLLPLIARRHSSKVRASATQMQMGVEVDETGCIIQSERRREFSEVAAKMGLEDRARTAQALRAQRLKYRRKDS